MRYYMQAMYYVTQHGAYRVVRRLERVVGSGAAQGNDSELLRLTLAADDASRHSQALYVIQRRQVINSSKNKSRNVINIKLRSSQRQYLRSGVHVSALEVQIFRDEKILQEISSCNITITKIDCYS